ncbi:MAG: class I SAM-dependent methyltransferase [Deltaproteobacteria bacterium]
MPTLEQNKSYWDGDCSYDWSKSGEEWSTEWGTSFMQWNGTILPRIRTFLPAATILEIAPGFGRWTNFLREFCNNLILVDLSDKCIKACQERFKNSSQMTYFVNDGKSLDMIPNNTIDFIFSFDSLVHVEDKVISAYVSEISKKLSQNGVAFIHHSNLGEYSNHLKIQMMIAKFPKLYSTLIKCGLLDDTKRQWRDPSMSARKMQLYAEKNDLQCISQELIVWQTRHIAIDCISTITRKDSIWFRDNKVLTNRSFMREAKYLSTLSHLYDLQKRK